MRTCKRCFYTVPGFFWPLAWDEMVECQCANYLIAKSQNKEQLMEF